MLTERINRLFSIATSTCLNHFRFAISLFFFLIFYSSVPSAFVFTAFIGSTFFFFFISLLLLSSSFFFFFFLQCLSVALQSDYVFQKSFSILLPFTFVNYFQVSIFSITNSILLFYFSFSELDYINTEYIIASKKSSPTCQLKTRNVKIK